MPTLLDDQIGMKEETTYGTAVVVDRFYPYLDGTKGAWDPRLRQGEGLRGGSGRRAPLAARNYPTIGQGTVTVKAELESKQGGVLLRAGLGVGAATVVTGGTQQLFHPGVSGTYLPSYTIQLAKIRNDGTARVETYRGCTASKVKLDGGEDAIPTIEVTFDAAGYTTATGLATAAYATNPVIFDSYMGVQAVGTSAMTVPTTTALATGPTASTEFREWSLELDHKITDDDWKMSTRGRPTAGAPSYKWSAKADFDTNQLPDWFVAGQQIAWMATYTTAEALGAGYTQLQVAVPKLVLTGDLPDTKPGELRVTDLSGDVLNDGTAQDFYVAYRTTDTVL